MNIKNTEKYITEYYECYSYQDIEEYFKNLSKQKLISKATYSILYHPMLLLAKTYELKINGETIKIALNSDHIVLLCYLMGYIKNKTDCKSYYGSNSTISKHLGVSVRTVQRRLKDLSTVGYINSYTDDSSYRITYVNFEKIFSEITKILLPDYNSGEIIKLCHDTVVCFIEKNLLEKSKQMQYILFLRMQYLLQISKAPIPEPIRFFYSKLAEELEVEYSLVKNSCEKARENYIKKINEKN